MNSIEAIRKVFNSKDAVPEREISSFELTPEVYHSQPVQTYTINTQELKINKDKTLTPLIFCDMKYKAKLQTKSKQRLVVFENMLSNVVYAYYSSEYDISSIMESMAESSVAPTEIKKDNDEALKKRNRSKKNNSKKKNSKENGGHESYSSKLSSLVEDKNLLDYLVSPLKFDFEFGRLKRKVVFKGNRHF